MHKAQQPLTQKDRFMAQSLLRGVCCVFCLPDSPYVFTKRKTGGNMVSLHKEQRAVNLRSGAATGRRRRKKKKEESTLTAVGFFFLLKMFLFSLFFFFSSFQISCTSHVACVLLKRTDKTCQTHQPAPLRRWTRRKQDAIRARDRQHRELVLRTLRQI